MINANPGLLLIFMAANLTITAGYFFLAVGVVPKVRIRLWRTKIGGIGFFLLCGLTHLNMALQAAISDGHMSMAEMATQWHMLAIHVPQAITVWMFVTGLYIEIGSFGLMPLREDEDAAAGGDPL